MHELIMDCLSGSPSLTDGMCHKSESCRISDGEDLYIGGLADLIYSYPSPFGMDARRKEVQYRDIAYGHDHEVRIKMMNRL